MNGIPLPDHLTTLAENMALGEVLTEWGGLTYDEVSAICETAGHNTVDDDRIIVWQVFENSSGSDISDQLDSMNRAFLTAIEAGYRAGAGE
jgi:hypothetical protein